VLRILAVSLVGLKKENVTCFFETDDGIVVVEVEKGDG
jgi:hypothetical protein